MVGSALKFLQDDSVPWHRVVGSGGVISERGDGGAGAQEQVDRLRCEQVAIVEAPQFQARGRYRVQSMSELDGHGWCTYVSLIWQSLRRYDFRALVQRLGPYCGQLFAHSIRRSPLSNSHSHLYICAALRAK